MADGPGNRYLSALETMKVKRFIDDLIGSVSVQQSVKRLLGQINKPDASPFERYAGMALEAAGGNRIGEVSPFHVLRLLPPEDGKLVRIACAAQLDDEERAIVTGVENALNRLVGIADAIEDGFAAGARASQGPRLSISIFGASPISDERGYRSAYVKLPRMGLSDKPTVPYFNEVDWRVVDHIASNSHTVFQNCLRPNTRQSIMGAFAPDWSDWDVRTRLASILEGLELPFTLAYSFDCDATRGIASVHFRMPAESTLPAWRLEGETARLVPIGDSVDEARMAYTMRLACLLAAACFGSGRTIDHAYVVALRDDGDDIALSCAFERTAYVHTVLTAIDEGTLSDPRFRFDVEGLADLMAEGDVRFSLRAQLDRPAVEAHEDGLGTQRANPWEDGRELTDELQRIFHSSTIAQIDCTHYLGPSALEIDEAKRDADDSPIAAIARLESIVANLESALAPPGDDADARPLYCGNPYTRAIVSLLDDAISIGLDAEAYLHDDGLHEMLRKLPRYFRAPNALYHAHMGLSDLYERLGDMDGAEAEANRCITLAPTTVDAHFRKAHLLAQQGRFVEAANVIIFALPLAVAADDCAILYYHLGLLLWNLDRKADAAAVFTYAASFTGEYAEKCTKVVAGLRKRKGESVIVHASPKIAAREMARARIPVAPGDDTIALAIRAMIGLSCMGAPRAAAPYSNIAARAFSHDSIIVSACRSLVHGTASLTL